MNNVVLVGRLTRDPELKYIPGSGTPVATFAIAVDRDFKKKDGTRDTDFIPVQVMGKAAEYCANYITKGGLVAVQGSIRVDRYEQNGENKTFTKVFASKINNLTSKKEKEKTEFKPELAVDPQDFAAINDGEVPF